MYIILREVDHHTLLYDDYALEDMLVTDAYARVRFFESRQAAEAFARNLKGDWCVSRLPGRYPQLVIDELTKLNSFADQSHP